MIMHWVMWGVFHYHGLYASMSCLLLNMYRKRGMFHNSLRIFDTHLTQIIKINIFVGQIMQNAFFKPIWPHACQEIWMTKTYKKGLILLPWIVKQQNRHLWQRCNPSFPLQVELIGVKCFKRESEQTDKHLLTYRWGLVPNVEFWLCRRQN